MFRITVTVLKTQRGVCILPCVARLSFREDLNFQSSIGILIDELVNFCLITVAVKCNVNVMLEMLTENTVRHVDRLLSGLQSQGLTVYSNLEVSWL